MCADISCSNLTAIITVYYTFRSSLSLLLISDKSLFYVYSHVFPFIPLAFSFAIIQETVIVHGFYLLSFKSVRLTSQTCDLHFRSSIICFKSKR